MCLGFDVREREWDRVRVAVGRERVDPWTTGIAEAEELGNFVEGFAGGVVEGAAYVAVGPAGCVLLNEVEMGVPTRDDKCEGGKLERFILGGSPLGMLQENSVDVPFEVVDGDERQVAREGQGLGVTDSDKQGACEPGAFRDGDGVEVGEGSAGFVQGCADDGDDVAEVFARCEFRDDASIGRMGGDL